MDFHLTESPSRESHPTAENRVWGIFGEEEETSRENRPQNLQPRRENHSSTTKLASGVRYYGFRYFDPVTGRWPSRDPIGERGGINLYGMVKNNLIFGFDFLGLEQRITVAGVKVAGRGHHYFPAELWDKVGFSAETQRFPDTQTTTTPNGHNLTGHGSIGGYTGQVEAKFDKFKNIQLEKINIKVTSVCDLDPADQKKLSQAFFEHLKSGTTNGYIKGFNGVVKEEPEAVAKWVEKESADFLRKTPVVRSGSWINRYGKKVPLLRYSLVGAAGVNIASAVEKGDKGTII